MDGDQVRYRLLSPSYSHSAPARSRADFERFLRAAVAYHSSAQTDASMVEEALTAIRHRTAELALVPDTATPSPTTEADEEPSELSHQIALYYLVGGHAYDAGFEQIAASKDVNARFMLARLLGAISEEPARRLLVGMLSDANSLVQGEAVRQRGKSRADGVGPILHAHLAGAAGGAAGPTNLMDPVRNVIDGGKLEIVRTLGELKYQAAAADLIRLLEEARDGYSARVLLEALHKMGNRDYGRALEKPLRNPESLMTVAQCIGEHRLVEAKAALERVVEEASRENAGGPHWTAIEALGKIGDDDTGARLTAMLQRLTSRAVPEFFDDGVTQHLFGALATLNYKPARAAVQEAFFYWLGVDSSFAEKPDLLKLKQRLERKIEGEAAR